MLSSIFESVSASSSSPADTKTIENADDIYIDDYKVGVWITKPIQQISFVDHHALIIYAVSNSTNIIIEFSNSNTVSFRENIDLSKWFIERRPKHLNHSKEIIKRALMMFNWQMEYNLWCTNCDHFVNACYCGFLHSKQVTEFNISILNGIGCGGVGILSGRVFASSYHREAQKYQEIVDSLVNKLKSGYIFEPRSSYSDDIQDVIKYYRDWLAEAQKNLYWTRKMIAFGVTAAFICGVAGYICYTKHKQRNYRENVFVDEDGRITSFERRVQRKIVQSLRRFRSNMDENVTVDGYLRSCVQIQRMTNEVKCVGKVINSFYDECHRRDIMINDILEIIQDLS